MQIDKDKIESDWMSIYWLFRPPSFYYEPKNYPDERAGIHTNISTILSILGFVYTGFSLISLIWIPVFFIAWGCLIIYLPFSFKNIKAPYPKYGFYFWGSGKVFHILYFHWNHKMYSFRMPWAKPLPKSA